MKLLLFRMRGAAYCEAQLYFPAIDDEAVIQRHCLLQVLNLLLFRMRGTPYDEAQLAFLEVCKTWNQLCVVHCRC